VARRCNGYQLMRRPAPKNVIVGAGADFAVVA
jgi:hypothetical protein